MTFCRNFNPYFYVKHITYLTNKIKNFELKNNNNFKFTNF